MKKILAVLLSCLFLVGCGNKENISNDNIEFELDSESLLQNGYEEIAGLAYLKLDYSSEKPICYIQYESNHPQSACYLMGALMEELNYACDFVIVWDGKEYKFDDVAEENYEEAFPVDWKDTIEELQNVGVDNLVTKAVADTIDESIERFCAKNVKAEDQENKNGEENTEIVDVFQWGYDENNSFGVNILKDVETEKVSLMMVGNYEEGNKSLMQFDFAYYLTLSYANEIDSSAFCMVGEESYMFVMSDGQVLPGSMDIDKDVSFPEEYEESFREMSEELTKFYEKNGLIEKTSSKLLYEDEKIKINFSSITDEGVEFIVENLTDVNITIQADTVSINGVSTNDIIMSDDVAPQSKGKVVAKCDDFSTSTIVETVGGQLRVIDFSHTLNPYYYDAKFVNVPIE